MAGQNYYWRHSVPTYPTYEWTASGTPPQPGAELVSRVEQVFNEVPSGVIDGVNDTFTTEATPDPTYCCFLYLNGILLREGAGNDFVLSGNTITFQAGMIPKAGDDLRASYHIQ